MQSQCKCHFQVRDYKARIAQSAKCETEVAELRGVHELNISIGGVDLFLVRSEWADQKLG